MNYSYYLWNSSEQYIGGLFREDKIVENMQEQKPLPEKKPLRRSARIRAKKIISDSKVKENNSKT